MTQPTVNQVVSELKDLDDEKVQDWIVRGLRFLDAEKLKYAIENDIKRDCVNLFQKEPENRL